MARASRWLRWSTTGLVSLIFLMGLTLTYVFNSTEALKPVAKYLTQRFTGYELTIDGPLQATFSLQPRFSASSLKLSNAAWASDPYIATVGALVLQINLPALLERNFHILDLEVIEAQINIEVDDDQRSNLDSIFRREDKDPDRERWDWAIEGLDIESVVANVSVSGLPDWTVEVEKVVEHTDAAEHLVVKGNGELNDENWQLEGRIGSLQALLDASNVDLAATLTLDDLEISTIGSVSDLRTLEGFNLDFSMTGPDASIWGEMIGMAEAFQGDAALKAEIRPRQPGMSYHVEGHVADYDILLDGTVDDIRGGDGVSTSFTVEGPEAGVFGKVWSIRGFPTGPFTASGEFLLDDAHLEISDFSVVTSSATLTGKVDFNQLPSLSDGTIQLQMTGPDISQFAELLRLPNLPALPFEMEASRSSSTMDLTATVVLGAHRLQAIGEVGDYPDFHGTRILADAAGPKFGELSRWLSIGEAPVGPYRFSGLIEIGSGLLELVNAKATAGPFSIEADVQVPDGDFSSPSLRASYQISSLHDAGTLFALESLPDWPVNGTIELQGRAGQYQLTSFAASAQRFDLKGHGSLGTLTDRQGTRLALELTGPALDELVPDDLQIAATRDLPFTLVSDLQFESDQLVIQNLLLSAAEASVTLSGSFPLTGSLVGSSVKIGGNGPNLGALIPLIDNYRPPEEAFSVTGAVRYPKEKLLEFDDLSLTIDTVDIDVSGAIDVSDSGKTNLSIRATGSSLAELGHINDRLLPDLPFQLESELQGSDGGVDIETLKATWGESNVDISGSLHLKEIPELVVRGTSKYLNIMDIQAAFAAIEEEQQEDAATDSSRLFSPEPFSLEAMRRINARIDISVDEFRGEVVAFNDIALSAQLSDGTLEVDRFEYRDDLGRFSGHFSLRPIDAAFDLAVEVKGEDADLGLFTVDDQPEETIPRYDIDVELTGRGASAAEIAGSLNGSLLISSNGGYIDNATLDLFAGDFLNNLLDTLMPFQKSTPYTAMDCLVLRGTLDDGILRMKPGFTARTDRVNVFVLGKVDLKREQLDLSFATQARTGFGISASSILNPYFKVGGSLTSPQLQLDATSAAIAASVATMTAGLSIVFRGLFDRIASEQDSCKKFLEAEL